jgi:hypothetical protein
MEAASQSRCSVRDLLTSRAKDVLANFLKEPYHSSLILAWNELQAFQTSVAALMREGFSQQVSEDMTRCLPSDVLLEIPMDPLIALPFLKPCEDLLLASHARVRQVPGRINAIALLRELEARSLEADTALQIAELQHGHEGAINYCVAKGWVTADDGLIQLTSNNRLQEALRYRLMEICRLFHPTYSEQEIQYAFTRLNALSPDMFVTDMVDEVIQGVNSRVLFVCHDGIEAAIEYAHQYSAVFDVLTNDPPTLVAAATRSCTALEDAFEFSPIPFYQVSPEQHSRSVLIFQFNLLTVAEIFQLATNLGTVTNLIAFVDVTVPTNAVMDQLLRYFPTTHVRVRQQHPLPLESCLSHLDEIKARINREDVQRIAIVCDCSEIRLHLNDQYSSVPGQSRLPKKGDLIRLTPLGFRINDDAMVRVVSLKATDLFVSQGHTYRSIKVEELSSYSWHPGFALSPEQAMRMSLPPVLVFTCAKSPTASAMVRNLKSLGVRVIEHCVYEIPGSPKAQPPGSLQRIVPLIE